MAVIELLLLCSLLVPTEFGRMDTLRVVEPRPQPYREYEPIPQLDLPHAVYELLVRPNRVTAVLVEGFVEYDGKRTCVRHHPVRSDARLVPARLRGTLAELLLSVEHDSIPLFDTCKFWPSIAYTFHRGTRRLDVLICHGCRDAAFAWGDSVTSRSIRRVNEDLAEAGLTLFPADPTLHRHADRADGDRHAGQ